MKRAGLVGGIAWPSTLAYYELINRELQARLGVVHSARLCIDSLDFAEVLAAMDAGQPQVAAALMADAARRLRAGGAELVAILANTGHFAADQVQQAAGVPLVHIVHASAAGVRAACPALRRLGLAGTSRSLRASFFTGVFEQHGFEPVLPGDDDMQQLDALIYGELAAGNAGAAAAATFAAIAARMVQRGAEAIVLGCTELRELLPIDAAAVAVPLFDSAALHARAIVDAMLAPDPHPE
jgi:aspartate racemase